MKRREGATSTRPAKAGTASSTSPGPALPAWKAFVVQFSRETESNALSGRVEHLSSGQRAHFNSADELIASLKRLLKDVTPPSE